MKCKGTVKKNKRTEPCNTDLHQHQIFCHICGKPTPALKIDLAAHKNFSVTWKEHRSNYQKSLSLGLFLTLFIYIPIAVLSVVFWNNYWITNLFLLFITPLALIPFASREDFTLKNYFRNLNLYPLFWLFVLTAEIYFFLLKVICTGFLLDIMIDPVLHIVRLIMVLYGLSCAFAAPFLIADRKMDPITAIYKSTKAGFETRWQQFFILIMVVLINLAGALGLLVGLFYSLPLSYKLLRRYYQKLLEFELFKSSNPTLDKMV